MGALAARMCRGRVAATPRPGSGSSVETSRAGGRSVPRVAAATSPPQRNIHVAAAAVPRPAPSPRTGAGFTHLRPEHQDRVRLLSRGHRPRLQPGQQVRQRAPRLRALVVRHPAAISLVRAGGGVRSEPWRRGGVAAASRQRPRFAASRRRGAAKRNSRDTSFSSKDTADSLPRRKNELAPQAASYK